jgi:TonB family protein
MNRLQKKCFIAAAGLHLLLVIILFVGPAFLSSSSSKMPDAPVLTFVPYRTTDKDMSGGGYRDGGAPPAPAPIPPTPTPAPVVPAPEPQRELPAPKPVPKETTPPKDTTIPRDPTDKPKRVKPDVSTTVVRRDTADLKATTKAKAAADARAAADAQKQAVDQMTKAVDRIGGGLSTGTSIKLLGPGSGGVPYANFLQGVKKIYSDAWIVPDGVKDDSATVAVSVTIARDGTVVSSRIVQRSGDAAVDASVQMTLDRVSRVVPLPDDSKDNQRTVTINFNVKSKLLG